jgi:hypothetical protein
MRSIERQELLELGAARAHLALGDGPGAGERARRAVQLDVGRAEEALEIEARALVIAQKDKDALALMARGAPSSLHGPLAPLAMNAHLDLDQPARAAEVLARTGGRGAGPHRATLARHR